MNRREFRQVAGELAEHLASYPLMDYGAKLSMNEIQALIGQLRKLADTDLRPSKFSGMCAEEIQKVAERIHEGEQSKLGTSLILIANLARILKEKNDEP